MADPYADLPFTEADAARIALHARREGGFHITQHEMHMLVYETLRAALKHFAADQQPFTFDARLPTGQTPADALSCVDRRIEELGDCLVALVAERKRLKRLVEGGG